MNVASVWRIFCRDCSSKNEAVTSARRLDVVGEDVGFLEKVADVAEAAIRGAHIAMAVNYQASFHLTRGAAIEAALHNRTQTGGLL